MRFLTVPRHNTTSGAIRWDIVQIDSDEVLKKLKYAVLSHRWLDPGQEVTLQDIENGRGTAKKGYEKIRFCARQAAHDGLTHFWIDSCCIDKNSSAEVDRSIRSMWKWYKGATKCYVYMSDVSLGKRSRSDSRSTTWKKKFRRSEWFKRGWTLQELIAPRYVEYFSVEGRPIRYEKLKQDVSEITKIPIAVLQGESLSNYSVQERFSWSEGRVTTVGEDEAYCLLGLLGVDMCIRPGEGSRVAKARLWKEVDKKCDALAGRSHLRPENVGRVDSDPHYAMHDNMLNSSAQTQIYKNSAGKSAKSSSSLFVHQGSDISSQITATKHILPSLERDENTILPTLQEVSQAEAASNSEDEDGRSIDAIPASLEERDASVDQIQASTERQETVKDAVSHSGEECPDKEGYAEATPSFDWLVGCSWQFTKGEIHDEVTNPTREEDVLSRAEDVLLRAEDALLREGHVLNREVNVLSRAEDELPRGEDELSREEDTFPNFIPMLKASSAPVMRPIRSSNEQEAAGGRFHAEEVYRLSVELNQVKAYGQTLQERLYRLQTHNQELQEQLRWNLGEGAPYLYQSYGDYRVRCSELTMDNRLPLFLQFK